LTANHRCGNSFDAAMELENFPGGQNVWFWLGWIVVLTEAACVGSAVVKHMGFIFTQESTLTSISVANVAVESLACL